MPLRRSEIQRYEEEGGRLSHKQERGIRRLDMGSGCAGGALVLLLAGEHIEYTMWDSPPQLQNPVVLLNVACSLYIFKLQAERRRWKCQVTSWPIENFSAGASVL